jgi:hypothetical protein
MPTALQMKSSAAAANFFRDMDYRRPHVMRLRFPLATAAIDQACPPSNRVSASIAY